MAKYLDEKGLNTLVGRMKTMFDEKIDKPERGEAGQVLTKTANGTEWATVIPGNPDGECTCTDLTTPEVDAIINGGGIIDEWVDSWQPEKRKIKFSWKDKNNLVTTTAVLLDESDGITPEQKQIIDQIYEKLSLGTMWGPAEQSPGDEGRLAEVILLVNDIADSTLVSNLPQKNISDLYPSYSLEQNGIFLVWHPDSTRAQGLALSWQGEHGRPAFKIAKLDVNYERFISTYDWYNVQIRFSR